MLYDRKVHVFAHKNRLKDLKPMETKGYSRDTIQEKQESYIGRKKKKQHLS